MIKDKILTADQLAGILEDERQAGKRVVFTNGCFDLLHAGHAQYLEEARALGDILVLGLNDDASVRRLKGQSRPIVSETDRALLVAALTSVDYVCIFSEDTPYELIHKLQPDILVKGGDWQVADIVGADLVTSRGGSVHSLPFREGLSSTAIIAKIKEIQ
ncbi:MAG: D-glycero-beta-D-manno-heptose 1-phosphate adenylyltransferase [Candidatus Cloacimonetes bacterium]|nr:D-glycero-beta-D-manno-heptose 1-phosphate adenylyltransferase [Candidatus Cloacimonadota bacterium]